MSGAACFVFVFHAYPSHHLEQVALELLKAGAAVDKQGPQEFTALMFASSNGHEQVCGSRTFSVSIIGGDQRHSYS